MKEKKHGSGGGMPYFEKGHWEKKIEDTMVADGKYCGDMDAAEDLKGQVDALANYAKKHKMKY